MISMWVLSFLLRLGGGPAVFWVIGEAVANDFGRRLSASLRRFSRQVRQRLGMLWSFRVMLVACPRVAVKVEERLKKMSG